MKDKKVKESTVFIYNKIKEMILNKELLPGSKIVQKEMADLLHTSRTPIVYSLHKLESEGLVDSLPNTGFFVHKLSIIELLDLFSVREHLEVLAVQDLVLNASDDEIANIKDLFHSFIKSESIDEEMYRKTDMEFHSLILSLCRNALVKKINEKFQIFSRTYTAGLIRPSSSTLDEHMKIIDALLNRDDKAAEENIRDHISITKKMLQETVDNLKKMSINPDTIFVDEVSFSDFSN